MTGLLRHHLRLRLLGALGEEGAGDDLAVYLAGALADLVDLDLPPVARHRATLHEPLAAVDLDRLVGGPLRSLRSEDLGHARLAREGASPVLQPRGFEDEVAGELYLHGHVGELELDGLELRDGPAELAPLPRAGEGLVEAGLREPYRERRDRYPAAVERPQELPEAGPALAEKVRLRYAAVLEEEGVLVGGAPAELLVGWPAGVARRLLRHDERGQLRLAVFPGPGAGDYRDAGGYVGAGVGDPLLRAVYDPLAAVELGGGGGAPGVRAGPLLPHTQGPEALPPRDRKSTPLNTTHPHISYGLFFF